MFKEGLLRVNPNNPDRLQYWVKAKNTETMDTNWTDVAGYAFKTGYPHGKCQNHYLKEL
jgi:hypothetical protein